ncbi:MAG: FimB/Mfa2 family fimbrial subunit [Bacteroidaceae bacterium]|nr:FimB/Mfa2 family fimbrial subunit [Bacteroidaceae bacterium]
MYNIRLFLAGIALLFAACSNDTDNSINDHTLVPVTVRVSGFSVSQDEFSGSRAATAPASYDGIQAITLAFYAEDGTEQYTITQMKGSMPAGKTFGELELSLPIGSYTMVVIGRGHFTDDVFTLNSPTSAVYSCEHVRETFTCTQAVNITNCDAVELSATLNRIVAQVVVNSTDNKTADVAKIRTTFSAGGKSFNPSTGLAIDNAGFSNTVVGMGEAGEKTTAINFLFLAADEQTVDVTVETLDADGAVLFSKTVNNVPLRRNRVTTLTGAMYSPAAATASFTLNTDWLPGNSLNF